MADDEVSVKFGANTGELNSGVDEAKDKLGELPPAIEEIGDAIAAVFTIDVLSNFIGEFANLGTQVERVSIEFGLSAEQVQEWGFAMKESGSSADELPTIFLRLQRAIQAAVNGAGAQRTAFEQLGISADYLSQHGNNLNGVLLKLADGYQAAGEGAGRNSAAIALMGRSVSAILAPMAQGSAGLKQLFNDADATGDVFNAKVIESFHSTHTALTELGASFQGEAGTILAIFIPAINDAITALTHHNEATTKAAKEGGSDFQNFLIGASSSLVLFKHELTEVVNEYEVFFAKVSLIASTSLNIALHPDQKNALIASMNDVFDALDADSAETDDKILKNTIATIQKIIQASKNISIPPAQGGNAPAGGPSSTTPDSGNALAIDADTKAMEKALQMQEQITKQATQSMTKDYEQMFAPINRGFDTLVSGMISGTQKFHVTAQKAFEAFATSAIESSAKLLEHWVEDQYTKAQANAMADDLCETSNDTLADSSDASMVSSAIKAIMVDAKSAYAGVFSFLSPTMGPAAAGPAAGAASTVAAAASFDIGSNYVPQTGLAMVHQGETIIPASQQGAGYSGGGGGSVNFTINSVDAKSVVALLNNPSIMRQFTKNQQAYLANNQSIRGNY